MPPLANKASDQIIDTVNRALVERRALSFFEKKIIEKNLMSANRAGGIDYYISSACYYSYNLDLDNLIHSSDIAFSLDYDTSDGMNILYSLFNAYQYKQIINLVEKFNFYPLNDPGFIDIIITSYVSCNVFDKPASLVKEIDLKKFDEKDYVYIAKALSLAEKMEGLLSVDGDEKSSYLNDCFKILQVSVLPIFIEEIGKPSFSYSFFKDSDSEVYDSPAVDKFLNVIYQFPIDDFERICDAEELLLANMAKLKYGSSVKSSIAFSFTSDDQER